MLIFRATKHIFACFTTTTTIDRFAVAGHLESSNFKAKSNVLFLSLSLLFGIISHGRQWRYLLFLGLGMLAGVPSSTFLSLSWYPDS